MNKYLMIAALTLYVMPAMFGGNSENGAFVSDYEGHYVNTQNPDVRFDWTNHRMAVPGQGGAHANENGAVTEHGDGTLVNPHDTEL